MKNKVYITSALIGISAGFVALPLLMLSTGLTDVVIMCVLSIAPALTLLLSFMLLKKFPVCWSNVKVRVACIVLALIVYSSTIMFTILLGRYTVLYALCLSIPAALLFIPLGIPYFFAIFIMPPIYTITMGALGMTITITAAYFVTSGIESMLKRIVCAFLLVLFICGTSASHIPLFFY